MSKQNNNERATEPVGEESSVGAPKDSLLQGGFLSEVPTKSQRVLPPRGSAPQTPTAQMEAGIRSAEVNLPSLRGYGTDKNQSPAETGVDTLNTSKGTFPSTRTYTK